MSRFSRRYYNYPYTQALGYGRYNYDDYCCNHYDLAGLDRYNYSNYLYRDPIYGPYLYY